LRRLLRAPPDFSLPEDDELSSAMEEMLSRMKRI